MEKIIIKPESYQQFGEPEDAIFCLVTNHILEEHIDIQHTGGYKDYQVFSYDEQDQFVPLLRDTIPKCAHVLIVSPYCFFRSPDQSLIGPRRKLIAMACNSTPTPLEDVRHFLRMIERTEPGTQQKLVDHFFEHGPSMKHMSFQNEEFGTEAIFDHLDEDYEWNIQAGYLGWGEQQISPCGEVSVLPADIWKFSNTLKLAINGELTFYGLPILHSGEVSFLREDQQHIFDQLKPMHTSPIIATIENGVVTKLRAVEKAGESVVRMLETMFRVDSRYRTVWELGFAVNTTLELVWDNRAMNEVFGGTNGCMHFGIGLTPYTQYHLDIICPGTTVYDEKGNVYFGGSAGVRMPTAGAA